jgi:hypothetical protein
MEKLKKSLFEIVTRYRHCAVRDERACAVQKQVIINELRETGLDIDSRHVTLLFKLIGFQESVQKVNKKSTRVVSYTPVVVSDKNRPFLEQTVDIYYRSMERMPKVIALFKDDIVKEKKDKTQIVERKGPVLDIVRPYIDELNAVFAYCLHTGFSFLPVEKQDELRHIIYQHEKGEFIGFSDKIDLTTACGFISKITNVGLDAKETDKDLITLNEAALYIVNNWGKYSDKMGPKARALYADVKRSTSNELGVRSLSTFAKNHILTLAGFIQVYKEK